ncbi:MAG: hypothetical protein N4A68_08640 [Maledivibacter sp.]|nr:hypothetical protein [Maledivibacter sp.]
MKKLLVMVCASLMILCLPGCSSETANQKTEEKLREEIRAELEAEKASQGAKSQENNREEPADSRKTSKETNNFDLAGGNLDFLLGYMNKDINELCKAFPQFKLEEDDQNKFIRYSCEDYDLYIGTSDGGQYNYKEDHEKAGLTKDIIVAIRLYIADNLYDGDNETIIRYPKVSIGGIGFGMDTNSTEKSDNAQYYFEFSDNPVYSANRITNIDVMSQIQEDVYNGEYAPEFKIDELPEGYEVKVIDIGMTKDEVIGIMGSDYAEGSFENQEDGGNYTTMDYNGVNLTIDDYSGKVSYITISTNKVTGPFEVSVGDSAKDALDYCDSNYKKVENPHGIGEDDYLFGAYEFRDGSALSLCFDNYGNINSMEDVTDDTVVQKIRIVNPGYFGGI